MQPAAHIRALYLTQLGLDIDDERGDPEVGSSSRPTAAAEAQPLLSPASQEEELEQPLLQADGSPHGTHEDRKSEDAPL